MVTPVMTLGSEHVPSSLSLFIQIIQNNSSEGSDKEVGSHVSDSEEMTKRIGLMTRNKEALILHQLIVSDVEPDTFLVCSITVWDLVSCQVCNI